MTSKPSSGRRRRRQPRVLHRDALRHAPCVSRPRVPLRRGTRTSSTSRDRSGAMAPSRVAGPDEGSARTNAEEKTKSAADSNPDPLDREASTTRRRACPPAWIPTAGDAVVEAVRAARTRAREPHVFGRRKGQRRTPKKPASFPAACRCCATRAGYFHVHHESTAFLRRFATVLYYLDGPGRQRQPHARSPRAGRHRARSRRTRRASGTSRFKGATRSRNARRRAASASRSSRRRAPRCSSTTSTSRGAWIRAPCTPPRGHGDGRADAGGEPLVQPPGGGAKTKAEEGRGAGGAGTDGVDERGTSGRDELR